MKWHRMLMMMMTVTRDTILSKLSATWMTQSTVHTTVWYLVQLVHAIRSIYQSWHFALCRVEKNSIVFPSFLTKLLYTLECFFLLWPSHPSCASGRLKYYELCRVKKTSYLLMFIFLVNIFIYSFFPLFARNLLKKKYQHILSMSIYTLTHQLLFVIGKLVKLKSSHSRYSKIGDQWMQ